MGLTELSAVQLGKKIAAKEIRVREALDAVFAKTDASEGKYHCFITLDKEGAYRQAEQVQERIDAGVCDSMLAGVPMAVMDNLCTAGLRTTCASKMLAQFVPPYSAAAVERLQAAGAILIGKTNMDEFAMGSTTETSAFGITKNPCAEDRVPGGSSGGSAAAVAAGEAYYALGTDTGGSIRQPASHCGLVGIKPTYGSVSRYSMDQIGPLAKDVTDAAAVLELLCAQDPKDAVSVKREGTNFCGALQEGVKGLRIGIPKAYFGQGISDEVSAAVLRAAEVFKAAGAVVEMFDLAYVKYAVPAYYTIADAEASSNLERYDGIKYGYRAEEYADLHGLYRKSRSAGFGTEVKRRILLGTFVLSADCYEAYYLKALKVRRLIRQAFENAFADYDVILGPAAPATAPKLGESLQDPLQMYLADIYTVSANLTGLPAICLPCGKDRAGLPIGLQLTGRAFGEEVLFRAAYTYEKIRGAWQ